MNSQWDYCVLLFVIMIISSCLQRTLDVLKVDIEGSEWPFLRDLLAKEATSHIKQLIIEIHTPRTRSEGIESTVQDYAELHDYIEQLEKLNLRIYHHNSVNNCCGGFQVLVNSAVRGMNGPICCYEIFLVNGDFLPKEV